MRVWVSNCALPGAVSPKYLPMNYTMATRCMCRVIVKTKPYNMKSREGPSGRVVVILSRRLTDGRSGFVSRTTNSSAAMCPEITPPAI